MANKLYTTWKGLMSAGTQPWSSSVAYFMALGRSTGTYTWSDSNVHIADLTSNGWVEITTSGYARELATGVSVTTDLTVNHWASLTLSNIDFGSLASGQTVSNLIVGIRVAGSYVAANDFLVAYIDTDAGGILPQPLGGGDFSVTINANGLITIQ